MKTLVHIATVFLLIFLPITVLQAQEAVEIAAKENTEKKRSIFQTLNKEGILPMQLTTNLRQLIRKKSKEAYQPATLTYTTKDGESIERQIEIKSRGNMRLNTCHFPPIQLKFSKEELKAEGLKAKTKLKLVVACESSDSYKQLVLREYLVYKLFNVLTDNSFRVQLLDLNMEDSEGKEKPKNTFAFIIEHEDEVAKRMNGKIFIPRALTPTALEPKSYDLLSLFQYMVGNTDWFVLNKHNIKLVRVKEPKMIQAVPYDFDFSGIVDAPYAVANEKIPIKSVTERYFIGECRAEGQFDPTIQLFLDKKAEMFAVLDNCPQLSKKSKEGMIRFLQDSYKILENPKKIKQEIEKGCGWKPIN